jgi:hypothetical protein
LEEGELYLSIADMESIEHTVNFRHMMYAPTQPHSIVCLTSLQASGCGVHFNHPPYHIRWRMDGTDSFQHMNSAEIVLHRQGKNQEASTNKRLTHGTVNGEAQSKQWAASLATKLGKVQERKPQRKSTI